MKAHYTEHIQSLEDSPKPVFKVQKLSEVVHCKAVGIDFEKNNAFTTEFFIYGILKGEEKLFIVTLLCCKFQSHDAFWDFFEIANDCKY